MSTAQPETEQEEAAALHAYVDEEVARALERNRDVLPPDLHAFYAEELRAMLLTHPVTLRMLARIRPRAARTETGGEPAPAQGSKREAG